MRLGFFSKHRTDSNLPAGGVTVGTGFTIAWQDGPLGRGKDRTAPNGAFVEDVIDAARDRISWCQEVCDGRFKCDENLEAWEHLTAALNILDGRTKRREAAGTEGTHAEDQGSDGAYAPAPSEAELTEACGLPPYCPPIVDVDLGRDDHPFVTIALDAYKQGKADNPPPCGYDIKDEPTTKGQPE